MIDLRRPNRPVWSALLPIPNQPMHRRWYSILDPNGQNNWHMQVTSPLHEARLTGTNPQRRALDGGIHEIGHLPTTCSLATSYL
ncbi:hypothetical protein P170DRAFT_26233 [Aspergillus steynii IBT 23096]|uniref:Uncharacterized protein n=1 Tax=Aspergillus steynii IBT 23096 TaxID=1392250 RepID=A0A2I2GPQ3_9EURO|nr:uncharacterized protein P170DRAFT_26233 [Aspergillus steynii IBT 23096]PLB54849.1 hypothetical protein P170DRAFT_26233 [Aspergillus steynii IBT 23096]